MKIWLTELKKITDKGIKTYAFFNNHYAGFAPGSVQLSKISGSKSSASRRQSCIAPPSSSFDHPRCRPDTGAIFLTPNARLCD
jgi:hypothetical protein